MDTVVYHDLNPIIEARYIRVLPTHWFVHISMRMELYTCQGKLKLRIFFFSNRSKSSITERAQFD